MKKLFTVIAVALTLVVMFTNSSFAQVLTPQGRLTLQSSQPVMTSDDTNATTVYYVPYLGQYVPISTAAFGGSYTEYTFGAALTLTLSPTYQTSGNIYDVFVFVVSGSPVIGLNTTPWHSLTGRSTTGCDTIEQYQGIWVNAFSFTLTCSFNNGSTIYQNTDARDATYLGSVYMTGNGETSVQFKPTPAAGGTGNVIGIWNSYNRVPMHSISRDSNTTWTNSNTSNWQTADNSTGSGTSNRVTWLDGLQQTQIKAHYKDISQANLTNAAAYVGINLDSTTATPDLWGTQNFAGTVSNWIGALAIEESFPPQYGLHYVQAMEFVGGASPTITLFGNDFQSLILDGEY